MRLVHTLNYIAIADIQSLQIIAAHPKAFQFAVSSPVVSWQWLLIVGILQLPRSLLFPLALNCTNSLTNLHSCSNRAGAMLQTGSIPDEVIGFFN
jgi:hypothetical protein